MKVDGVELLRMIKEKQILNGVMIKNLTYNKTYVYKGGGAFFDTFDNDEMAISVLANNNFEILLEEDKKIDIDEVLKIEKDHTGSEYVFYKNKGETESNYSRSYSYLDVLMAKAIKQLNNTIKNSMIINENGISSPYFSVKK